MGVGPQIPVGSVTDLMVAGIPVRLAGADAEQLLTPVYLHGGGWVLESLISHDNTTRYFLTQAKVAVLLHVDERANPLASPLLAADELLAKVAPAYVAVAGHAPLRDEGEAYAKRLAAVGVPTTLHRNSSIIRPFLNSFWVWKDAQRAMDEAVGALRQSLGIIRLERLIFLR